MALKILVVDDEIDVAKVIEARLLTQGYDVQSVSSSVRALSLIKARKPDLILLDIMMPEMDGGDVVRELRQHAYTKDIPVIFLSAAYSEASIADSETSGINVDGKVFPALGKPVDMVKLYELIKEVSGKK